jgi:hypothetical protein
MTTALFLTQHVAVPVHSSSEVSYTWWFPEYGYINQVILGKASYGMYRSLTYSSTKLVWIIGHLALL